MRYRKSKYSYYYRDATGNLLMCNFVKGSSSFLKVEQINVENVLAVISRDEIYDEIIADFPFLKELISKGYFIEENTDELHDIRTQYYNSTITPLLSLTIMPTEKCNFRCSYCYENFEKGKMTAEAQNSLLKFIQQQIAKNTHVHISWFGGEPLLAYDVIENIMNNVQQMCKNRNRYFTSNMTTNAYLLTLEKFNTLYDYGVRAYQVTLDGLKEDHDKQRFLSNGVGTFDCIVNNLLVIKAHKEFRFATITIRINITGNNIGRISEFLEYYKNMFGDDKRFNIRFAITGDYGGERVKTFSSNILSSNVIQDEVSKTGVYQSSEIKIADTLENFEPMNKVCYTTGRNTYTIGSDLSVYRCTIYFNNPNNKLGNISKDGTLEINTSLDSKWYIKDNDFPEDCQECFYFPCCYRTYCPLKLNFDKNFKCEIDNIKNQIPNDMEYLDCCGYFSILHI